MTKFVLDCVLGTVAVATLSIGGASVYRMFNPSSVGATLLKEGHAIIESHENDIWDKLVEAYEKDTNTDPKPEKIQNFSFKTPADQAANEEEKKRLKRQELKNKCWELLSKDYSSDEKDKSKENAKEWCTKSSSVLKSSSSQ